MASASPSDQRSTRSEEVALALLLGASRLRYSLPQLIKQYGRRRPGRFRQIRPTEALKSDMAAPHFAVANGWRAEADGLIAAYERGGISAVESQLSLSAARVAQIVAAAKQRFPAIVQQLERWHRGQWLSRVTASTGLDVGMLTASSDVADDVHATTTWNQALAEDVHQQAKHRITTALLVGLAAGSSSSDVRARINEAVKQARTRAAGIGVDQVDKTSRAMDRSRRVAAGLSSFVWHHTPQRHPRDWHLERDGRTFEEGDIDPSDRASVPPFCKCWEEPLWE